MDAGGLIVDLISFDDAKKRLGKSDAELEEMRKKGEIRAFKDGPSWKFRKEDVDRLAGPEAGAEAPAEGKESGDTLMSINADILFAEEEEVPADSAAETWIAADTEGVFPKGQGGGVAEAMAAPETEPAPLALSPETDESSLGAVLSEEELAGGEEAAIAVDAESGSAVVVPGTSATAVAPSRTRIVTLVEPPAHHEEFTFILGVGVVGLAVAVIGVMAVMLDAVPGLMRAIGSESVPLILLGVGIVVTLAAAGIGYFLQKQRAAREAIGA
ncbi:MAG: helix-turn-helix domain-containing protein [Planctomycetota bacterium]|jgi:hypothetical protein|nr:helix-turn-helix domain-containing protein [Planctomycetota bacterium]